MSTYRPRQHLRVRAPGAVLNSPLEPHDDPTSPASSHLADRLDRLARRPAAARVLMSGRLEPLTESDDRVTEPRRPHRCGEHGCANASPPSPWWKE